jgi:peptidoglycan hydrolase CwlO-like protein
MAQAEGVTPSQEDLLAELQALKLANPEMGAKKLQAAVKEKNPTWLVSEARVKKVATEAGLLAPAPEKPAAEASAAGGSAAAPAASKKPAKPKAQTKPEPTVPIAEVYPTGDWPVGEIME